MTLTITLPIPPKELSPNHTIGSRGGRMAKARKVKQYRNRAMLEVLAQVPGDYKPKYSKAEVRTKWFTKTVRRMDGDNALASLKAAFDGLTDSGFLSDDRGLTHHPIEFEKDASNPRVELTLIVP